MQKPVERYAHAHTRLLVRRNDRDCRKRSSYRTHTQHYYLRVFIIGWLGLHFFSTSVCLCVLLHFRCTESHNRRIRMPYNEGIGAMSAAACQLEWANGPVQIFGHIFHLLCIGAGFRTYKHCFDRKKWSDKPETTHSAVLSCTFSSFAHFHGYFCAARWSSFVCMHWNVRTIRINNKIQLTKGIFTCDA